METITKIKKYGLKKSLVGKTRIIGDEKSKSTTLSNFHNIKKINMEDVCFKLKNDLKWYRDDALNYNFRQNERNSQESIITKEFSEKTASKLVEEWWLGS